MIVYSVNCGHFPSFREAMDMRKRQLKGAGSVFAVNDCYTVKIFSGPIREKAESLMQRLPERFDAWLEVRGTEPKKENEDG